jgi:hypothetical protein
MLPGRSKSSIPQGSCPSPCPPASPVKDIRDDMFSDLDIRMRTAKGLPTLADGTIGIGDVHMSTMAPTIKAQPIFKSWEREALDNPEVKRKATVAQLCEFVQPFLL